jgi:ATP-binding cassette subfamily B protein/ATP-binding cassette subfamily C protein
VNIFAMTVEENITLGHVRGDKEALWNCLNQVGLGKKIKKFPKQLRQPLLKIIEEDGTELSGGENQKLAIARALYKQGKMVILDEPTAALDALAESEIYQEMNELVGHKTAIYISHRLSSTKFCDRIALFADGKVIEYGTHDELMALQGDYYHMFVTQGKYYQSEQGGDSYEIVGEH